MNLPDVLCRAAVFRTGCTRRSRPRKAWRSAARTKRLPPSRFRIISVCTKNWAV